MVLAPDKGEILRYLGYRGQELDPQTETLLDACIKTMTDSVKPRFCYRVFTIEHGDSVFLPDCNLHLSGNSIKVHLQNCTKCVLLAVTLGIEGDNLIRISQADSMTRAVILDAVATELTEQLCHRAESELRSLAEREGCGLTPRFSPGYGDLPISLQSSIAEILDTSRQIGLTISEHSIMIPRKSVTAILGFSKTPCANLHRCSACSLKGHCQFQKEDASHGHSNAFTK